MAKQTGLGDGFFLDGYDLSGDVGSVGRIGGGPTPLEVTGIDKSAYERKAGRFDGEISWAGWWNDADDQEHEALSGLVLTSRIATYRHGSTLGNSCASLVGKQVNFDWNRGQDGSLTSAVQVLASDGFWLDWGRMATAGKRTDTGAANGSSIDDAAASSFGLRAYLHVFSFTGTSCTVTIQSSSDDGAGDAFAAITGGAFTAATGRTSQRIATATDQAVERYLRVVTSGTFSECTFFVQITRNLTAVE